jgi:hypothetical protein
MGLDITKEEWSEWRELRTTRAIVERIREYRIAYLFGITGIQRDRRIEYVDILEGMDLIIDMIENVHKEE